MTRAMHKLTARTVATAKDAGRYGDGAGLYLRVTGTGGKRWVFRYTPRKGARPREMGLGSAGSGGVSLARARALAHEVREAVQSGDDPVAMLRAKRREESDRTPTFGEFADEFVESQAINFRNDKHIAQWKMTLTHYAAPIRKKYMDEITTDDVLGILKPMWQEKHETANRLRGRIERVLNAAKAKGLRSGENPAQWRGHLDTLLPKRTQLQRGHFAAMPYTDIPAFIAALRARDGMAALALEFCILAACRSGEVRHLEWAELDMEQGNWTLPAEKTKAGRSHRVPLTHRMIEIVETVRPFTGEQQLVFASRRGAPLSDMTLSAVLKRLKVSDATVHGFRSSFRDWAGDMTDYPREVAEAALAHVVGDATERAYRRSDAFEKRRALMEDWEAFLFRPPDP